MSAKLETVEYYRDRKKQWRWRFRAINGRILAASSEGYNKLATAKKNFKLVRPSNITEASPVREIKVIR